MDALEILKNKPYAGRSKLEKAIILLWEEPIGYEHLAADAAEELAAANARAEQAQAELARVRAALQKIDETALTLAQSLDGLDGTLGGQLLATISIGVIRVLATEALAAPEQVTPARAGANHENNLLVFKRFFKPHTYSSRAEW